MPKGPRGDKRFADVIGAPRGEAQVTRRLNDGCRTIPSSVISAYMTSAPGAEFTLECEQWRHGVEPERFEDEIHFDARQGGICWRLECRIHAENLSDPAMMIVPVRINVPRVRSYDMAKNRVDFLLFRARGLKLGGEVWIRVQRPRGLGSVAKPVNRAHIQMEPENYRGGMQIVGFLS
jgi:hypothetical protein